MGRCSVTQQQEVVLILDDPSEEDQFEAGAHGAVAAAIGNLIENELGGIVIGLEGKWGSGKSTVVRLLRQKLDPNKTRVLIFDAWAHQGDRLRRTFLQALIEELKEAGWLHPDTAKELREQLVGRSSVIHTKSTARLSLEGMLTSVSVLFVPLGIAWINSKSQVDQKVALYPGIFLLLAPVGVVILFLLAKGVGFAPRGRRAKSGWRRNLSYVSPLSFFAKDQKVTSSTASIEKGEPTSVEFEEWFSDILSKSLGGDRRLLVVLDNLDRVEEPVAKTILATMQIFTGSSTRAKSSWASNVWTLIPYDPAGLSQLWNGESTKQDISPSDGVPRVPPDTPKSAAFIEKIFQVRFEAPPLVLSDWRGYLAKLLSFALPNVDEDDTDSVLNLRALYRRIETGTGLWQEPPTPRQLKQFVNQIGAIRRQRDDISLVHVAYFALLRQDGLDVAELLLRGDIPSDSLIHLFKIGVEEELAALYFGTTPALAQQLLLGGALEKALGQGDSVAVGELKERSGFADALKSLKLIALLADGGLMLTRTVATLEDAGVFDLPAAKRWLDRSVIPLAKKNPSWTLLGSPGGSGLAKLLDHMSPDDATFSGNLKKIVKTPLEADVDGHLQLEGVASLSDALIAAGRPIDSVRIRVEIPTANLSGSLSFFGKVVKNPDSRGALEISAAPATVATQLVVDTTSENFAIAAEALDVLLARPNQIDLKVLGLGCIKWLQTQDPTNSPNLGIVFRCVDLARSVVGTEELLAGPADDGTLMHIVSFSNQSSMFEQAAVASMFHLLIRPAMPTPVSRGTAAVGVQTIMTCLSDPSQHAGLVAAQLEWLKKHSPEACQILFQISANPTFKPWVEHQLRELSQASALIISPDQFCEKWQLLLAALSRDAFATIAQSLVKHENDRTILLGHTSDPAFVLAVLRAIPPDVPEFVEIRAWASGIVLTIGNDAWTAAFANPKRDPLLDLAIELAETGHAPVDPPGLLDAIQFHFHAMATSQPVSNPSAEDIGRLTGILGVGARTATSSQFCADLEGMDATIGSGLLVSYGIFLSKESVFRTHSKLPNFITRAVDSAQWDSVKWFVETARTHPDILQTANRVNEMEHLHKRVKEKIGQFIDAGELPPPTLIEISKLFDNDFRT
jgi:hypothetical protein